VGDYFLRLSVKKKAFLNVDISKFGKDTCSPSKAIAVQTKFWNQYWAPLKDDLIQQVAKAMNDLRDRGFEYIRINGYKFDVDDFICGLRGYNRESRGIDMWKASELKGLPRMCMILHADCIKFSIVKLAWPIQILISLQAILGKLFGVRTVTLTSLLYAIWNRSQDEVRNWEKEFAGDYDTCRPGSSALHAAVCRSAKAEICFWLQIHNATLLHDQDFFSIR
jgi:hypothetical protein